VLILLQQRTHPLTISCITHKRRCQHEEVLLEVVEVFG
jgi:hypothetical protein